MNSIDDVKILILRKHISLKKLAELITQKTGKKMLISSLSQKLTNGTLRYSELITICEILGYEITFSEKI